MTVQYNFPRSNDLSDVSKWLKEADDNFKALEEQDKKARRSGTLVGRYIQEQYADGYAFYVITKENKKSVRIHVVSGLGDDWVIPYWGEETSVDKQYALQSIQYRDNLKRIFANKKG